MSNTRLDRAGVKAKFDVFPEQIVDYLALVGDSSDNIPGITGVGPKTAAKWLNQYQTLDALVARAADIPGKVGENLRNELPALELSRKLATIDTALALEVTPEDLVPAGRRRARLRELYARLELRALLKSLESRAGAPCRGATRGRRTSAGRARHRRRASGSTRRSPPPQPRDYAGDRFADALDAWIAKLDAAPLICFGAETDSPDYMRARLVGLSFAVAPGRSGLCAARATTTPARRPARSRSRARRASSRCSRTRPLPSSAITSSSMRTFWRTTASRSTDSATIRCSSPTCSTAWRPATTWIRPPRNTWASRHPLRGRRRQGREADRVQSGRRGSRGRVRGRRSRRHAAAASGALAADRGAAPLEDSLRDHRAAAGARSVPDGAHRRAGRSRPAPGPELRARGAHAELQTQAHAAAGGSFNVDSPKQLQEILFGKLGLPVVRKTPTGQPSTAEDVLEELAAVVSSCRN